MLSGGFEPTIPAIELLQTHALDRAATGNGKNYLTGDNIKMKLRNKSGNGWAGFMYVITVGNSGML